jgi:DNA-binding transcriptional LysR family regulator
MNLKQLPYFIAISEAESLSAAAEVLKVSQPNLSLYLSKLEAELKTELFTRNKKKLVLTTAGWVYLDAAKRMLDIQSQTLHNIEQEIGGKHESVYVGTSGTRGAVMIAKTYSQFIRRYPGHKLNVVELLGAQTKDAILKGQISLWFGGFFNMNTPGMQYIPFMVEELVLAVPVYHQLAHLAEKNTGELISIDINLFKDSPFALAGEGTEVGKASDKLFADAGLKPTVVYRSGVTSMINSAAKAGMGIGVVLASYAEPCPELVYFRIKSSPLMHLCALHKTELALSEPERYLLYLQIKVSEERAGYKIFRNEYVDAILAEFDSANGFKQNAAI